MSDAQIKNWDEYKAKMLDGLSGKKAEYLGIMLENTHVENVKSLSDGTNKVIVEGVINESTSVGSTVTANITRYDTMFAPLVRRTMVALLAMDLVGVQPLNMPRGIVRTMRMRYSETTANGGPTAGTEASGVSVYDKYSLLALGGNYDAVDALNPFQRTEYLEGNRGKPMDLEVVTQSVETYGRKLSAAYSLEAADDLGALDGLDIESELTQSLGDEMLRDLDREIIGELNALAGIVESFDFALVDGRYAGERLAALSIAIDNLSAQIAMKIKKGGATWMVVSQKVFTGLKHAANGAFTPANSGDLNIASQLFVGTFSGRVKVYVDPYATTDTVLLGYKGSELDTGLVYLPYIPLSSSGVVRNPETGDHRVLLRTRYAMHKFIDEDTSLGNSPDFYARATIANINLGFTN